LTALPSHYSPQSEQVFTRYSLKAKVFLRSGGQYCRIPNLTTVAVGGTRNSECRIELDTSPAGNRGSALVTYPDGSMLILETRSGERKNEGGECGMSEKLVRDRRVEMPSWAKRGTSLTEAVGV
jgi:hypothetical protein